MYVCYNLYACACGCGWVILLLLMMVVLRMAVRSETSERGRPTSKPARCSANLQASRHPGPGAREAGKSEGGSKAKAPPGVGVGRSGRSVK